MRQPDDYTEQDALVFAMQQEIEDLKESESKLFNESEDLRCEVEDLKKERDIALKAFKELSKCGSSAGVKMFKIIKAANAELEALNQVDKLPATEEPVTEEPKEKESFLSKGPECSIENRIDVKNGKCIHGVSTKVSCDYCNHGIPF
ncbi:hypothetical protein PODOV060v1_p0020 [Vibrio phage 234P8]|nr:hypothetical protein PODOV060v1_p0020 [Vibrio phage 234P8]